MLTPSKVSNKPTLGGINNATTKTNTSAPHLEGFSKASAETTSTVSTTLQPSISNGLNSIKNSDINSGKAVSNTNLQPISPKLESMSKSSSGEIVGLALHTASKSLQNGSLLYSGEATTKVIDGQAEVAQSAESAESLHTVAEGLEIAGGSLMVLHGLAEVKEGVEIMTEFYKPETKLADDIKERGLYKAISSKLTQAVEGHGKLTAGAMYITAGIGILAGIGVAAALAPIAGTLSAALHLFSASTQRVEASKFIKMEKNIDSHSENLPMTLHNPINKSQAASINKLAAANVNSGMSVSDQITSIKSYAKAQGIPLGNAVKTYKDEAKKQATLHKDKHIGKARAETVKAGAILGITYGVAALATTSAVVWPITLAVGLGVGGFMLARHINNGSKSADETIKASLNPPKPDPPGKMVNVEVEMK